MEGQVLGSEESGEPTSQATRDAKQRLLSMMIMSKFARPDGSQTAEAPYGRDHANNPITRQQAEQTGGHNPWDSGVVGGESLPEAVGMNLIRTQQNDVITRLFAAGTPTITPSVATPEPEPEAEA